MCLTSMHEETIAQHLVPSISTSPQLCIGHPAVDSKVSMLPSRNSATGPSGIKKEFMASGKSGIVYCLDNARVVKEFMDPDDFVDYDEGDVERRVYCRLGSHPNVARLLEVLSDGSIILERGKPLRTLCSTSSLPDCDKARWLQHAATGYQHLHDHGVVHGDVGCHNLILAQDGCVKLIDFEGSGIDGSPAGSYYEWFSAEPSSIRASRRTDIFAFGATIYEVMTGRPPFSELKDSWNSQGQVKQLYMSKSFPDIANLPLGTLAYSCWSGTVYSMSEIVEEIKLFIKLHS